MRNLLNYLAILLSALLLAGCGTGGSNAPAADTQTETPPATQAPAEGEAQLLPAPSQLLASLRAGKSASAYEEYERILPGAGFDTTPGWFSGAMPSGSSVLLDPEWLNARESGPGDLAFALYAFTLPGYNGVNRIAYSIPDLPGSHLPLGNIGLANWDNDRWDWLSLNYLQETTILTMDPYIDDATGTAVVAPVFMGTGNYTLEWVRIGGNAPPVPDLQSDTTSGNIPLEASFDASTSVDYDGSIARYDWDFNGDGSYELQDALLQQAHTYTAGGTFNATVRVWDDANASSTASIAITAIDSDNAAPEAALSTAPSNGAVPLEVTLDASGGTDSDGSIETYDWDFDGDGTYDVTGSINATAQYTYNDPGEYHPAVRVTDDDGAQDVAPATVSATSGGGAWTVSNIADGGTLGKSNSAAVISGNPAVAYYDASTFPQGSVRYIRAADSSGASWGARTAIATPSAELKYIDMEIIGGRPAVCYFNEGDDDLYYVRALDSTGGSWGTVVKAADNGGLGQVGLHCDMEEVDGRPAIAYWDSGADALMFLRANNAEGSSWPVTATPVDTESTADQGLALVVVNGNPAIAYVDNGNGDLLYVRALNATGSSWGITQVVDAESVDKLPSLAIINGSPAIAYVRGGDLYYTRSGTASGGSWSVPVQVGERFSIVSQIQSLSLASVGAKPAIAFHDGSVLRYTASSNATGSADSWPAPGSVEQVASNLPAGGEVSLIDVGGYPGISFYADGNNLGWAVQLAVP